MNCTGLKKQTNKKNTSFLPQRNKSWETERVRILNKRETRRGNRVTEQRAGRVRPPERVSRRVKHQTHPWMRVRHRGRKSPRRKETAVTAAWSG